MGGTDATAPVRLGSFLSGSRRREVSSRKVKRERDDPTSGSVDPSERQVRGRSVAIAADEEVGAGTKIRWLKIEMGTWLNAFPKQTHRAM